LDGQSSYWLLLAGLIPLGAGMGAAMTPATTAITEALPRSQQGVASALNDLSREVGRALGIAVIGSILNAVYRSHLSLPGAPGAVADKARDSFGVAAHIGGSGHGACAECFRVRHARRAVRGSSRSRCRRDRGGAFAATAPGYG
jgi:MFS family permease